MAGAGQEPGLGLARRVGPCLTFLCNIAGKKFYLYNLSFIVDDGPAVGFEPHALALIHGSVRTAGSDRFRAVVSAPVPR